MKQQRSITNTRLLALALGTAFVLAACGQALADSPNSDPTTTTQPAPTSTTAPEVVTSTTTVPSVTSTTGPATTTIPPSQTDTVAVMVYLIGGPDADLSDFDCSSVTPAARLVEPPALLTNAIEALLEGPTSEELQAGYDSWFSADSGWTVESVTVTDGTARIDFSEDSPLINNASTSCGSMSFLAQLDSTATQFPSVDRAVYSFGGDTDAFYGWLQRSSPEA